jgi:hypothetical protein
MHACELPALQAWGARTVRLNASTTGGLVRRVRYVQPSRLLLVSTM